MERKTITTSRSAQLFLLPPQHGCEPTELWIVLHGYGQKADSILKEFACIQSDQRVICAPEALSRFYLSGTSGEIGSSWMTTRFRDDEIEDYINYLETCVDSLRKTYPAIEDIHVVGFSQGTATATRWIARSKNTFAKVVLWGGTIAHDIDIAAFKQNVVLNASAEDGRGVHLVVGSRDKYIDEQRIEKETIRFDSLGFPYTLHRFEGGHRLDRETLIKLAL